jgi:putative component of toxin-antitoxin plasmid stabilization module
MLRLIPIRSGSARGVYALERDGRCEAFEFLRGLPERAVCSLDAVFQRLAEVGSAGKGEERFRHLRGTVYELKEHSSGVRLYCFRHGRFLVCTHGSAKRAGRARLNQEIDKVVRLYELCKTEAILK